MSAASAGVTVRAFRDGDWESFAWVDHRSFGYTESTEPNPGTAILQHDRSLIAEVDGAPVGIASAYGRALSVPGGSVPSAGTTWVGVLPTHRRRGVMTAMLNRHLDDSAARGDVVAVLWASEAGIYGRFGFGVAARAISLSVPSRTPVRRAPRDPDLRVRIVDPPDAVPTMAAVHDAAAARRPGAPSRDDTWWQREVHDPPHYRDGASERRALVVEGSSGPRGYATYATVLRWDDRGRPDGDVRIRELVALDPAARALLWEVLLGHDLMRTATWRNAPTDEPLLEWVDLRGIVTGVQDQLYLRILDLPAALGARAYAAPLDVVLEVSDDVRPDVAGRWRLAVGADGRGEVSRSDRQPHLRLDARDLGAAYLGGRSLVGMARAGLVDVADGTALAATSRAFRYEPDAWCPSVF